MPTAPSSLRSRAALALAVFLGFYVLGIALSALLIWIPVGIYQKTGRGNIQLTWFCFAGAAAILWSFRPRREAFTEPGPRLSERDFPELFASVRDVARKTDQATPDAVYLVPAVNAFVGEHGGKRYMGLGLPLLQALTVSEFRAVLAHEFGHYVGGDVKLGPIVYRTHRSIARTLQAVSGSALEWPFVTYGKLFLRVSTSVSRNQEYLADALAARTESAAALASGLRKSRAADVAYAMFLDRHVVPALDAGVVPPLTEGFDSFARSLETDPLRNAALRDAMQQGEPDPYATHPPLADRLAALERVALPVAAADDRPAIVLLGDPSPLEVALASHLKSSDDPRRAGSWGEIGELVYIREWVRLLNARKARLASVAFADLPSGTRGFAAVARQARETLDTGDSDEEVARRFASVVGMAIAVALHKSGWRVEFEPGRSFAMREGEALVEPFSTAHALSAGAMPAEDWARFCRERALPQFLV